jgi:hypothetical protein
LVGRGAWAVAIEQKDEHAEEGQKEESAEEHSVDHRHKFSLGNFHRNLRASNAVAA